MSLLTIYRVESATGTGPYQSPAAASKHTVEEVFQLASRHTDAGYSLPMPEALTPDTAHLHPGPRHDLGWRWERMTFTQTALDYRFGFISLDRARQWFFGERDTLEHLRMQVAAYEVPHQAVLRGQWQVAFRQASARRVRTMTIQEAGVE